eukprot:262621-Chlamydomonas_euryale.AAC.12
MCLSATRSLHHWMVGRMVRQRRCLAGHCGCVCQQRHGPSRTGGDAAGVHAWTTHSDPCDAEWVSA